jgi:transposase
MSGKRRKYTPEFREQAARLVIETGRPVAHVAAEIGVGEQVLGRWVRLQRQAAAAGDTGAVLEADERAELERLRRENAELRLDRAFLKKVLMVAPGGGPPGVMRIGDGQVAHVVVTPDADDGVCRA